MFALPRTFPFEACRKGGREGVPPCRRWCTASSYPAVKILPHYHATDRRLHWCAALCGVTTSAEFTAHCESHQPCKPESAITFGASRKCAHCSQKRNRQHGRPTRICYGRYSPGSNIPADKNSPIAVGPLAVLKFSVGRRFAKAYQLRCARCKNDMAKDANFA